MPRPEAVALALAVALLPAAPRGGDGSVVLRWKPVAGAVEYELEIAADPDLRRVVVRERVRTPGYRWRELPDERRWWRVRGVDAQGRPGRWSEVKPLDAVLRPPEPRRPADGATVPADREVELAAAASPVLEAYELEIAEDPEFERVAERKEGAEPRFEVALRPGTYHWRVRATSVDGRTTRWSAVRRLTVTAPVAEAVASSAVAPAEVPTPTETATETETATAAGSPTETPTAPASPPAPQTEAPIAAATENPPPPSDDAAAPPDAAAGERAAADRGRLRGGVRLGWHTNLGRISSLSPGVQADWTVPGHERLSLSARVDYYGSSSTVAVPGLASPLQATARVVPVGAAIVWQQPVGSFALYGGAGAQAQLAYTAVAGAERLDVVPGALLLAGAARRVGRGEVFAEAGWASGALETDDVRLRTGGLSLSAGFRGGP